MEEANLGGGVGCRGGVSDEISDLAAFLCFGKLQAAELLIV